ncbi:hypothetical protein CR162_13050 [Pseudoroseomonas rhizosphaerae]|uniref:DUF423 domain-containing protein n=1 Tax=Teichococcus rhizosphaerae TaxID=1335062 RepID=A0A2C7A8S1_9PROT|nr:DUF423 domain-containing protein [Pseudoroseomonas rhizosphaerae]PHK94419.1 hypothetical protein CR162_13050 [Pseudoroseomonas rhizosphaerae]
MPRLWLVLGALSGLVAVALSAWAAHGLVLDEADHRRVQSALTMQGWHALALLAVGLLAERRPGARLPHLAGGCFVLGSLGFCGAVWWLVLRGWSLGIAPQGGTLLMLGWLLLAAAALRKPVP